MSHNQRVQVIGVDGETIADADVSIYMADGITDQLANGSSVCLPKYDSHMKQGFDKDADRHIPVHRIGEIRVESAVSDR